MMRGGSIVTTLIFSIIFLKVKVSKNQLAGSALVLLGVFIVGLSNMIFKEKSGDGSSEVNLFLFLGTVNCWIFVDHYFTVY